MLLGPIPKLSPEILCKAAGLPALGVYLWSHPPFLDWVAIVSYLAVTLGVGILTELGVAPGIGWAGLSPSDHFIPRVRRNRSEGEPHQWRDSLLALGEDGLCFVPLLLVGANPVTAEVTAVAVAVLHFPEYPLKHCVWKAIHVWAIAIVVLPYGLGCVAFGHLIALAIAYRFGGIRFLQPVIELHVGRSSIAGTAPAQPRHPERSR